MMDQKTLVFVKGLMVFVTAFRIANTFCMVFSVRRIRRSSYFLKFKYSAKFT
jgi:hypothetical protein